MTSFTYQKDSKLTHDLQYIRHLLSDPDAMPSDIKFTTQLHDYLNKHNISGNQMVHTACASFVRLYWLQAKGVASTNDVSCKYHQLMSKKDKDGLTWADKLADVIDIDFFKHRQQLVDDIAKNNADNTATMRYPLMDKLSNALQALLDDCHDNDMSIVWNDQYNCFAIHDNITKRAKTLE